MVVAEEANTFATSKDNDKHKAKQNETALIHEDVETNSLLPEIHDKERVPNGTDYKKYGRLDIRVTWLNWLIGPICFMTFFAMVSSFYCLTEYTKHYFKLKEFAKANLSLVLNDSDSKCSADPDDTYYQAETRATSEASKWNSYFSLAGGIPSVIANLFLGAYTDALGRKFLLVVGILGSCIRLIIAAVIIYFESDLYFILIACLVEGCTGQHASILQASLTYIADITDSGRKRIFGIIYIEFAVGLGLSSATFVTGYIVDAIDYEFAMTISAGVLVLNIFIVLIALPETLTKDHRKRDRSALANLKKCFRFFIVDDSSKARWKYQIVLISHILVNLSFLGRLNTETLYQLASPFCWSPTKVGVYAAIRTLAIMFIGLGSIKLLQRCMDDITICMLGIISYGAAFYWTAFASDDITLYLIIAVGCFGPLSITMQRSILSHLTPPESQGAIFTAVGVIEVASFTVANASNSAIYAATVSYRRGLVFLVQGSYDVASLVLLIVLKIGWSMEKKRYQDSSEKEILVRRDNYGATEDEDRLSYRTSVMTEQHLPPKLVP